MISALSWLPRGVAKSGPQETKFTEEELAAGRAAAEGLYILFLIMSSVGGRDESEGLRSPVYISRHQLPFP